MTSVIHYRIFGNAVALSLHSVNSIVLLSALQDEILLKDPDIKNVSTLSSTYVTIWNVVFQLLYAIIALTSDVLTVLKKDHLLPKPIKKFRDIYFCSIVWPGTVFVFSLFWPLYLWDRSLVFPTYMDRVITPKSNYVIHLAILLFVLWEIAFQPRKKPMSHTPYIAVVMAYYSIFNIYMQLINNETGLWPYPLLYTVYESVYYIIPFHIFLIVWCVFCYYVQWPIHTLFWGNEKKIEKSS